MSHKLWFAAVAHSHLPPPRGLLSIRAGEVSARECGCATPRGRALLVYERGPDNTYQRQEVLEIKHRGDGAYDFVNEKGETLTISFHALSGDLFVGQAKGENDQPGYGYTMIRLAGNDAVFYVPQCDDQDKTMLAASSVEVSGQLECIIDRVADAPALFKRLDPGAPVSKLVRE